MLKTIATASDKKFFRILTQFIYSFKATKEYLNSELIVYDLGFSASQNDYLMTQCQSIPNLSVRKFPFETYPDFVKDNLDYYAWKPIIVDHLLNEKKNDCLWLDSATILFEKLDYVWNQIHEYGFYTPIGGSGKLGEWTHPGTLNYMKVSAEMAERRNVCGCMCGFSYNNPDAMKLVAEWKKLCLTIECLAPEGADRSNHKFDQSILTILLHRYQEKFGIHMTADEVNISSDNPVHFLSVRNKVPENMPIFLNPLTVLFYKLRRNLDILINRIKQ